MREQMIHIGKNTQWRKNKGAEGQSVIVSALRKQRLKSYGNNLASNKFTSTCFEFIEN
jgi:hypothetical protein